MNEHYHSTHGAIAEAIHVFILMGWKSFSEPDPFRILEIGMGTGLNVMLSALQTHRNPRTVQMTTLEAIPLPESIWSKLNYAEQSGSADAPQVFEWLHSCAWEEWQHLKNFSLLKRHVKVQEADLEEGAYDLIYFDAFGPDRQPDMWTVEIFEKLFHALASQGRLVTYSAKGQVRRDLKSVGFQVEKVPGPPGKREMIRALKEK